MHVLAVVAGTQQGDVFGREVEMGRATTLHEGQGLKRLDGRPGKSHGVGVTRTLEHPACYVYHRHGPCVNDFSQRPPRMFYKRFKGHVLVF
jgi:hypothetical protein